eukprot:Skav211904  [mRNA]  locus=scaffold4079:7401:20832:+ [translate_table: standard]
MQVRVPPAITGADLKAWPAPDHLSAASVALHFRLGTYNVNSLKEWTSRPGTGQAWVSRSELLRMQAKDYHMLMLQETCARKSQTYVTSSWISIVSGAHRGQGGCEIWLRKDLPFAKVHPAQGRPFPIFLQEMWCTVLRATHRCLIVKYDSPEWKMILVNIHSHHEHASEAERVSFWSSVYDAVRPFAHWHLVLAGDANARIGTVTSPHVGPAFAELENQNGAAFHRLLSQLGLFAPGTFYSTAWVGSEQRGTWKSRTGWHRLDHICVPLSWQAGSYTMEVDGLGIEPLHDDHLSVTCEVHLTLHEVPQGKAAASVVNYDRTQLVEGSGNLVAQDTMSAFLQMHEQKLWQQPADQSVCNINAWFDTHLTHWLPKKRHDYKSSWISDVTWQHLCLSRRLRRHAARIRSSIRLGSLRVMFAAWKAQLDVFVTHPGDVMSCLPPSPRWLPMMQTTHERCCFLARQLRSGLARSLRRDEARFIEAQVASHSAKMQSVRPANLWSVLKQHLPRWRKRAQQRGLRFETTQQDFTRHFASIEEADIISLDQICQNVTRINRLACQSAGSIDVGPDDLPTIYELEAAIRAMPARKSVAGPVTPELLHVNPALGARILFPAMVDFFLYYQQPWYWKGGVLCPLLKKPGAGYHVENHRSILVSDVVPRLFHRILRARLLREVSPSLQPMQVGGLKQMSVGFASLMLGAMREEARRAKRSHAVLFVDVTSAFYRAQRSTVVDDQLGIRLPSQDEDLGVEESMTSAALPGLGVGPHLRALVATVFEGSWSQVKSQAGVSSKDALASKRGTRPGDPIADLSFTSLVAKILSVIESDLGDIYHRQRIGEGEVCMHPIVWIDDLAFFLTDTDPMALIGKVQRLATAVQLRCRSVGLDVNYRKGKTEALFRIEGTGAHHAQRHLHELGDRLPIGTADDGISLGTSTSYTHLGVRQSASMKIDLEADCRLGAAAENFADIRPLLRHRFLQPVCKLQLCEALVLSRLLYATETWLAVPSSTMHRLQTFLNRVHRCVYRMQNRRDKACSSDLQLRAAHAAPSIKAMIAVRRLLRQAPPELRSMLWDMNFSGLQGFRELLCEDLVWLRSQIPEVLHLPEPAYDLHSWLRYICKQGGSWKRMCKMAAVREGQQLQYEAMCNLLRPSEEHLSQPLVDTVSLELAPQHVCPKCAKAFHDKKSLAIHALMAHQAAAPARAFMPFAATCLSCLKTYHTTQKLRQHLQYARGTCLGHLRTIMEPMPPEEIQAVVTIPQRQSSHRLLPWRLPGPLLPTREQWERVCPHRRFPEAPREDVQCPWDTHEVILIDWLNNVVEWHDPSSWQLPSLGEISAQQKRHALEMILEQLDAFCPSGQLDRMYSFLEAQVVRMTSAAACIGSVGVPPTTVQTDLVLVLTASTATAEVFLEMIRHFESQYDCRVQVQQVQVPLHDLLALKEFLLTFRDHWLQARPLGVLGCLVPESLGYVCHKLKQLDGEQTMYGSRHADFVSFVKTVRTWSLLERMVASSGCPSLGIFPALPGLDKSAHWMDPPVDQVAVATYIEPWQSTLWPEVPLTLCRYHGEEVPWTHPQTGEHLCQYWGYQTCSYNAPMQRFAVEFKTLVRELHRHGIEVVLDVVFNHTGEGAWGVSNWNCLAKVAVSHYYLMSNGYHTNYTGCGNTLNANNPNCTEWILDCLRYWALDMHAAQLPQQSVER